MRIGIKTFCDSLKAPRQPIEYTSAHVSGRGRRPSRSVKSYSAANSAATTTDPFHLETAESLANAATARPMNSGLSELLRSKTPAASRARRHGWRQSRGQLVHSGQPCSFTPRYALFRPP